MNVADVERLVETVEYATFAPALVVCVLTLLGGWQLVGHARCGRTEDFDAEIGRRQAYGDAFAQLLVLERYRRVAEARL